jgi:hypothetical protein
VAQGCVTEAFVPSAKARAIVCPLTDSRCNKQTAAMAGQSSGTTAAARRSLNGRGSAAYLLGKETK